MTHSDPSRDEPCAPRAAAPPCPRLDTVSLAQFVFAARSSTSLVTSLLVSAIDSTESNTLSAVRFCRMQTEN